ncbi:MAG: tripartite tricarboxylate transporter TctB family protein [Betaproteobacteria bacterium]|nr:tripartite tricarboxylate transporter TctB family protein [Betaproteobacteria bacterium]MDH5350067.1 tripartite tricarboxylate transporter TctB family protein [Betaproteobacteria bacterium]
MRAGFLAGVLLLAGGYTWLAFAELAWLSSAGRLGPAFFPRIIGVALMVLCAWSLGAELAGGARERPSVHWRAAAALALLSGLFVAALEPLGGLLAMAAYLAAALAYFNRRRHWQNALLAVLLPLAIYLLFRVWLGASVPRGPLGF